MIAVNRGRNGSWPLCDSHRHGVTVGRTSRRCHLRSAHKILRNRSSIREKILFEPQLSTSGSPIARSCGGKITGVRT